MMTEKGTTVLWDIATGLYILVLGGSKGSIGELRQFRSMMATVMDQTLNSKVCGRSEKVKGYLPGNLA